MKKTKFILLGGAILISLFGLLASNWYRGNLKPVKQNNTTPVEFIIDPGTLTSEILENLKQEDLIRNILAVRVYLKYNKYVIQAGKYSLSKSMSTEEIFQVLSAAEDETVWVTIPEGLRYDEIADIWAERIDYFDVKIFNDLMISSGSKYSFEGYIFPDTYNVTPGISEQEVFSLMTKNFENKVGSIDYDTLILASIIEREALSNEERPIIAGILQKRLDTPGWLLQADATLLYEVKNWKATITQEMKEEYSEYNTYWNPDLPPTPICNPGLNSIGAARNPDTSTSYWFYIHDAEGNIHYAVTQEQHNQNIYQYLY